MTSPRTFGRSPLVVSRLGLGLAALGRPAYMVVGHDADIGADKSPEALERRCRAVLDRALALGVRYVDAARSYGRAEEFISRYLADHPEAADVVIGSKWGYAYTAGWRLDAEVHEVKEHSLARFEQQRDESRALLGERLSIYQIHSATLESGVLSNGPVLDALARLRDEGVIIGLSTTGPEQAATLRAAMAVERGGARLFGAVQSTYNLLEPSVAPALAEAHEAGLGVVVKEGLANGVLAARSDEARTRPLVEEAARLGTTPDALALAAVLALPFVDSVLSGASTVAQLESNAAALTLRYDDVDADKLAALAEPAAQYWSSRKGLAWT